VNFKNKSIRTTESSDFNKELKQNVQHAMCNMPADRDKVCSVDNVVNISDTHAPFIVYNSTCHDILHASDRNALNSVHKKTLTDTGGAVLTVMYAMIQKRAGFYYPTISYPDYCDKT